MMLLDLLCLSLQLPGIEIISHSVVHGMPGHFSHTHQVYLIQILVSTPSPPVLIKNILSLLLKCFNDLDYLVSSMSPLLNILIVAIVFDSGEYVFLHLVQNERT